MTIEDLKKCAIHIEEPNFNLSGNELRSFRMKLNMTQTVLADYLGVSKKAIEKWEQGKNPINPVVQRMVYLINEDKSLLNKLKKVDYRDEAIFHDEYIYEASEQKSVDFDIKVNEKHISNNIWVMQK